MSTFTILGVFGCSLHARFRQRGLCTCVCGLLLRGGLKYAAFYSAVMGVWLIPPPLQTTGARSRKGKRVGKAIKPMTDNYSVRKIVMRRVRGRMRRPRNPAQLILCDPFTTDRGRQRVCRYNADYSTLLVAALVRVLCVIGGGPLTPRVPIQRNTHEFSHVIRATSGKRCPQYKLKIRCIVDDVARLPSGQGSPLLLRYVHAEFVPFPKCLVLTGSCIYMNPDTAWFNSTANGCLHYFL